MHGPFTILLLLAATTAIAIIARGLAIPYPIAFVLGGTALAFVPHLPSFALSPDLIFVLVLPPLLFAGGWATDLEAFRKNLRSIILLATGLVIATTVLCGLAAHALAPELTLASAFVLGAIVSPPDAVAASTVFERISVPQRITTILEGEGLVNDATALVVYGFAVAAVSTGVFSPGQAALAFVGVSVGGIAVGLAAGFCAAELMIFLRRRDLSDSLISNLLSLAVPYAVYLIGGAAHVSSVLATVTAGIYTSRRSSKIYDPESRLIAGSVWELMTFLINAFVFLLIGLQLPLIMPPPAQLPHYLLLGGIISAVVVVVRIAWVFPGAYLPHLIPHVRNNEDRPGIKGVFVIGWSGMRGVVSLAAALALPEHTASGAPFPGRSTILFVSFCVIFVTLVAQGLSLIPLLKFFDLDGDGFDDRELEVRITALEAGIARLRELESGFQSVEEWQVESQILSEYAYRIGHLRGERDGVIESGAVAIDHRLQREALKAEHRAVLHLRDAGEIPDEIFRRIRYDLDLAAARLA